MTQHVVELKDIQKIYRSEGEDVTALKKINLTVDHGEMMAITGHSGSGKSTLMHILGCLDHPTSGHYLLNGKDVSQKTSTELARFRANTLGFVFQSFNLLPSLTVEENVALPLYYGKTSASNQGRIKDVLNLVGLGHRLKHKPDSLSGGERQRAAVARALVNQPQVVFADEPTGNLDSRNTEIVIKLLESLNQQGNTIVIVTHEDDIASRMKRVIEITDGEIIRDVVQ